MTTQITQESFEAFLKCPTKSRLYSNGAHGIESEFDEWQRRTQERYNAEAAEQLRSFLQASEWYIGAPPTEQFNQRCYRLIFDYRVADPEIQARFMDWSYITQRPASIVIDMFRSASSQTKSLPLPTD